MTAQTMPLARLLADFTTGDEIPWEQERAWLEQRHPEWLARLRESIAAEGIREPVRLCYREHRVIDGHHRIIAAQDLGLTEIPVADAWEDGWDFHACGGRVSGDMPAWIRECPHQRLHGPVVRDIRIDGGINGTYGPPATSPGTTARVRQQLATCQRTKAAVEADIARLQKEHRRLTWMEQSLRTWLRAVS